MPSLTARRSPLRPALVALAASALLAAVPATTAAAPGAGSVSLTLGGNGKAAESLADSGVRTGSIAPAKKRGKRITLPVQKVAVGKAATVTLRGGLRFKAGDRVLKLGAVRLLLKPRSAAISAKAGKRLTLFSASLPKGKAKLDPADTTAKLTGAKLVLTHKGAKLLRSKLGVDDIAAGALGKLGVDAKPRGGSDGGPGGGGPGGGGPQAGPIKNEPPVLARPVGAVDITTASMTWRPRESWIQYVHGGQGTSVFDGAVNGPPAGDGYVYSFGFPFRSGWYHAATGTAAVYFNGGVGFSHDSHGINFSSSSPEIEINGGVSRAIFTFNGTDGTTYDNQRGVLVDLHPAAIQSPPGGEVIYHDIPATVPDDAGASIFAGFYPANAEFGTLSVSFTTPTP